MWEFKRLKFTGQSPDQVFQTLNELGAESWQIIQYEENGVAFTHTGDSTYLIILKRLVDVQNIN